MAATRITTQDVKDAGIAAGDLASASVTFAKLNLAANPGLEDGGADATRVKVAAPITLGAGGVGVSDFTSGSNNPGLRGTVPAPVLGDITKFLKGDGTWAAPASGGVTGPASSTDNAIVRWNGVGGTAIQDSTVIIDDSDNLKIGSCTFAGGTYYSVSFGPDNTISINAPAFAFGSSCQSIAAFSLAVGDNAKAEHYAEFAHASGYNVSNGTPGSAQHVETLLIGATTDATPKEIFIGNGTGRFTLLASGTAYACLVKVQARKTGGGGCFLVRQVLIERNGTTTQLVGAVQTVGVDINSSSYAVTLTADDTNDSLKVVVTGAGTDSLGWVVAIQATKIKFV